MKEEITPIKDKILNIFSCFDDRIMFLHQCSSNDFIALNKAIKENYFNVGFIIEKEGLIFEKAGDQGNVKTLGLFMECISSFKQDLLEFETESDQTLASLERILSNFSLMFVPINNFRQNLASLKLLLSNIKLTNIYFDKSLKSFSESEAIQIVSVINKVRDSCPVFEENIYNLRKHIKQLYTELLEVKGKVLSDILKNFEIMQSDIECFEKYTKSVALCKILNVFEYKGLTVETDIFNEQFMDITQQIKKHLDKYLQLAKEISLVNRIVTDLYQRFQDIEMIESAIEQRIIDKISFGDLMLSPEKETASQAQQILKLYADNHFEKNKIKTLFENTRLELKEFICRNMEYVGNRKGIEKLAVHTAEALEYFTLIKENLAFIEGIQDEHYLKSEDINATIKQATDGVKYYGSFDTKIDKLIGQFEQISMITKNGAPEIIGNNGNKIRGLEHVEKNYTSL